MGFDFFGLFSKKCSYCQNKISEPIRKNIKVPGSVGVSSRDFCSEEHADTYQKEVNEYAKKGKGGCCG